MSLLPVFLIILQVIILDAILSIDNAAALAVIADTLPNAPAPKPIRFLGSQKIAALRVGILGAYVGRGLMLLLAGLVLSVPLLKLAGAAYLLYLVGKHFFHWAGWEPEFKGLSTFWKTVIMIEIADLAFSLDNVAAVVAISSNLFLIILGVFISIIFMRFAAQIFMKLIAWEPYLEHAAYVLIFAIAVELLLKFFMINISEFLQFCISMAILAVFIVAGQIRKVTYAL